MSDRERLLAAFDSGKLVRPSPGRLNIVDLANAIASIGGAQDVPYSPGAEPVADLIGPADHIVFVIVDGLGLNVLDTDHGADFLAAHVVAELATVFPSSTPTVLTSYATGLWPLSHGVPSWYLYLEEVDSIATIIHFSRRGDDKDLGRLGLTPDQAYPTPSLASKMAWSTFAVVPEKIANTPFSSYCRGNSPELWPLRLQGSRGRGGSGAEAAARGQGPELHDTCTSPTSTPPPMGTASATT